MENLEKLINELRLLPKETPWVEFKVDSLTDPKEIGEYICALGNSATLHDKNYAYLLWGIHDQTHEIVGTHFDFYKKKKGADDLIPWLTQRLSKNFNFEFDDIIIDNKKVVVLRIERAMYHTIRFMNNEYIRIESQKRSLKDLPQIELKLWDKLRSFNFESFLAKESLSQENVIALLDCQKYFDLKNIPFPSETRSILYYFIEDKIIARQDDGLYSITNLGALLLAKKLSDFPSLLRKAIRLVVYSQKDRNSPTRDYIGQKGYASGFEELIDSIKITTSSEIVQGALRTNVNLYPEIMIRETVANALIHQDLSISGSGPLIEVFPNRIEVTNPGKPLIDTKRFIDNPPRSRNEQLASLMRQFHICEELGSGWDKIAIECELKNLPAPTINVYDENIKVTLHSYIPYFNLTMDERIDACYMHACIKWLNHESISNSSLRRRFQLDDAYSSNISKIIKAAVKNNFIKPVDPKTTPRNMRYYPFWG